MIAQDLEHTWQDYVRQSGASEEVLLKALDGAGRSKADILAEWRDDAAKSIKNRLIYGKVVENEKIEVSDEEIDTELQKRADEFNMKPEELENMFWRPPVPGIISGNELVQTKLFDYLIDAASVKKGEKIDYTDLMAQ